MFRNSRVQGDVSRYALLQRMLTFQVGYWKSIAESVAFSNYKKDSQNLAVILTPRDNVTTVHILLEYFQK